ncbi:hypothetical protein FRC10_001289, partial [Ceratobasidium sp. 414]
MACPKWWKNLEAWLAFKHWARKENTSKKLLEKQEDSCSDAACASDNSDEGDDNDDEGKKDKDKEVRGVEEDKEDKLGGENEGEGGEYKDKDKDKDTDKDKDKDKDKEDCSDEGSDNSVKEGEDKQHSSLASQRTAPPPPTK